jgi:hypothetical protein
MPSHKHFDDGSPELEQVAAPLKYSPPRIDPKLLTIVVHPSPYSRRTPLSRSRKPILRRRWSS